MKSIRSVRYVEKKPVYFALYSLPSTILYVPSLLAYFYSDIDFLEFVLFLLGVIIHALMFLATIWSKVTKCQFEFKNVSPLDATDIFVVPTDQNGKPDICRINKETSKESKTNTTWSFIYQTSKFLIRNVDGNFEIEKVVFPISRPVKYYLKDWKGHTNQSYEFTKSLYGSNGIKIPTPQFKELLLEQASAPFFVFQVFSIGLWCLDEYWYFSIFTLLMLTMFEAMVAKQRLMSIETLRLATMHESSYVSVYRDYKWMSNIDTNELVCGDIISLKSKSNNARTRGRGRNDDGGGGSSADKSQHLVPCDLLLLRGNAVTNEAMLTGESVPQLKESLLDSINKDELENDSFLSVFPNTNEEAEEDHDTNDSSSCTAAPIPSMSHAKCLISAGTAVVQSTLPRDDDKTGTSNDINAFLSTVRIPMPTDGGLPAYVLKTGWNTSHGQLLSTMLYAQERVTANNAESFGFIGFLFVFAVIAAGYVLDQGWRDPEQDRWKLILHCIMILTSVVPPELPMELSLAVNTSLANLQKVGIFCTEPFRIPFGGKVDVCCFDKTGTLTSDNFIVEGIASPLQYIDNISKNTYNKHIYSLQPVTALRAGNNSNSDINCNIGGSKTSSFVESILACCHSLVRLRGGGVNGSKGGSSSVVGTDNNITGDPLEVAALNACDDWEFKRNKLSGNVIMVSNISQSQQHQDSFEIVRRFPFRSSLRRMTCILKNLNYISNSSFTSSSSTSGDVDYNYRIVSKGAPEVISRYLQQIPAYYNDTYHYYATRGYRVLALAYRDGLSLTRKKSTSIFTNPSTMIDALSRDEVEVNLKFVGFLVLNCPLKRDSAKVVRALLKSSHGVVMITGDAPLTACAVARDVKICKKEIHKTLILNIPEVTPPQSITTNGSDNKSSSSSYSDSQSKSQFFWKSLDNSSEISFDEGILEAEAGWRDLVLTGDGLHYIRINRPISQFHHVVRLTKVFSRVSPSQKAGILMSLKKSGFITLMCGDGSNDVGALKKADVGVSILNNPQLEQIEDQALKLMKKNTVSNKNNKKQKQKNNVSSLDALQELELQRSGTIVKFGDASIASPFTCRSPSIKLVSHILRYGRCTLVTTIQMCKILAVNSLFSAYQLSVLYLNGVKGGDTQSTIAGMFLAGLYFFLSSSKPLKKLDALRPASKLFSIYVLLSVLLQFAIHVSFMVYVVRLCEPYATTATTTTEVGKEPYDVIVTLQKQHMESDATTPSPSMGPHGDNDMLIDTVLADSFQPNIINTVVYLLTMSIQCTTFLVNYRGKPFMTSLLDNKLLFRGLMFIYSIILICLFDIFPPLNDIFELVSIPHDLQYLIGLCVLVDVGLTFCVERIARYCFESTSNPYYLPRTSSTVATAKLQRTTCASVTKSKDI